MIEPLLIGIDLGTTQTKAGLFDRRGNLVALARRGYPILAGEGAGWAEQDPNAWWAAITASLREISAGASGSILALCCGGQGPTVVMSDERGEPLTHAILWMDTRAQAEQAYLTERIGAAGGGWSSLPKALWLKRYRAERYARARWLFSAWDYIAFRLCGRAATSVVWGREPTPAEVITQADLDPALFPPACPAGSVIGQLTAQAAAETGLPVGLPVVAGVNDGTESFLGAGLVMPGRAVDTGGTSGGFWLCWGSALRGPGVLGGGGLLPGQFICGGAMAATGKSLDWYRESILHSAQSIEQMIAEAAETPAGADGLIFLPYLAGERSPHWDPAARGVWVGLTLRHQRAHLTRAILEGAAFAVRDVAQRVLAPDPVGGGGQVSEMWLCGGPARSPLWNQIKADVTGFCVVVPRVTEVAVLGAAMLAGLGVGAFSDPLSAVEQMVHAEQRLEPRAEHRASYDKLFRLYQDLYVQLSPIFKAL
ncbi:MAG: hypothetical protein HYR71_11240 [Chloroflexi bacterium]|nr:hypothetical protein [Chloroflexota bacterium]